MNLLSYLAKSSCRLLPLWIQYKIAKKKKAKTKSSHTHTPEYSWAGRALKKGRQFQQIWDKLLISFQVKPEGVSDWVTIRDCCRADSEWCPHWLQIRWKPQEEVSKAPLFLKICVIVQMPQPPPLLKSVQCAVIRSCLKKKLLFQKLTKLCVRRPIMFGQKLTKLV